jgi:hypothetical protein
MTTVGLKTFKCRVRAGGYTLTLECLAPSPLAAAYAMVERARRTDTAPWHQVVVSEWSGVLGEYIEPRNAIVINAGDPPPEGCDQVVFHPAGAQPDITREDVQ